MSGSIRIVLVETSHPGNIGGVARAMKNMGFKELCLVAPKIFPHADATSRASGADDILASASVCATLAEALADCQVVIGASARSRTISWPEIPPRTCAEMLVKEHPDHQAALVFGRENSGLMNHELDLCHYLLKIPSNPDYSSLNLVCAVQIVCYELLVAAGQPIPDHEIGDQDAEPPATGEQMELFYQHLQETLADIGFLHSDQSKSIMRRLRRLYNRSRLNTREVDILRGILRMSQDNNK